MHGLWNWLHYTVTFKKLITFHCTACEIDYITLHLLCLINFVIFLFDIRLNLFQFFIYTLQYVFAGSRTFVTKWFYCTKMLILFRFIWIKLFINCIKISLEYITYRREYLKISIFFTFFGIVLHKKCYLWILRDGKCKTKVCF